MKLLVETFPQIPRQCIFVAWSRDHGTTCSLNRNGIQRCLDTARCPYLKDIKNTNQK